MNSRKAAAKGIAYAPDHESLFSDSARRREPRSDGLLDSVRWGDATYDEMLMGLFEYTMENQSLKPSVAPNPGGH